MKLGSTIELSSLSMGSICIFVCTCVNRDKLLQERTILCNAPLSKSHGRVQNLWLLSRPDTPKCFALTTDLKKYYFCVKWSNSWYTKLHGHATKAAILAGQIGLVFLFCCSHLFELVLRTPGLQKADPWGLLSDIY